MKQSIATTLAVRYACELSDKLWRVWETFVIQCSMVFPKKQKKTFFEQRKRTELNHTRGRNLEDTNPAEENVSHEASSSLHTQECYGVTAQNVPRWASTFNLRSNNSLTNIDEVENNYFHCESDDDEAAQDVRFAYTRNRYEAEEIALGAHKNDKRCTKAIIAKQ